MVSPVCGLRPWRADRSEMANFPNPERATSLPGPSSLAILSRVTSMASLDCPALRPVSSATVFASSVLLMVATRDPPVDLYRDGATLGGGEDGTAQDQLAAEHERRPAVLVEERHAHAHGPLHHEGRLRDVV